MSDTTPGVQAQHQAQLNAGQFLIQRCTGCSQHVYFPRESCPHCGAHDLQWVAPSGYGTVYSTTTIARKPEAGGNYNVSLIDLDEGVRMMSRVEGVAPEAVHIGLRVQAHVAQKDGRGLVLFQPAAPGGAA